MARAVEHARNDHGVQVIPPEVGQTAQAAIRDEYANRPLPTDDQSHDPRRTTRV
jgi:hypothetical protein